MEKLNLFHLNRSNNSGAVDMKMDESVLEENAFYKLELSSSSKLDLGYFIVLLFWSPRKLKPLIRFMKFLSPEVAP